MCFNCNLIDRATLYSFGFLDNLELIESTLAEMIILKTYTKIISNNAKEISINISTPRKVLVASGNMNQRSGTVLIDA